MRTRSRAVTRALVLAAVLAAGCTTGDIPTTRRGPVSLEDMEAVASDTPSISIDVPSLVRGVTSRAAARFGLT